MSWLSKNSSNPKVADIHPREKRSSSEAGDVHVLPVSPIPAPRVRRPRALRTLGLALLGVVIALPLITVVGYVRLRSQITDSIQRVETSGAAAGLASWSTLTDLFEGEKADISKFFPLFQSAGQSYKALQTFAVRAVSLAEQAGYLSGEGFDLVFGGRGEELIARLKIVEGDLDALYEATTHLPREGITGSDEFWDIRVEIGRTREFLKALIPWLETDQDRHFAVFLENSSEVRPGGGFLGSYIELTLRKGAVTELKVRDINDPDRLLGLKTVPPLPLQRLVRNWRAADANWFFDFPVSAKKTLAFLEASGLYASSSSARGQFFDGVLAVSPQAVQDILVLTGPVELASGKKLDAQGFLASLQTEVQEGQAAGADSPKKILGEFTPALLQKIRELDGSEKAAFFAAIGDWMDKKDLRVYFTDPRFQSFAEAHDLTGSVAELPEGWNGEYLAVVNANIGGGKTDAIMEQAVTWQNQITTDGLIRSHVVITRTNKSKAGDAWWYRVPNENYLQVFAAPGSKLTYAQGGRAVMVTPKTNYATGGYFVDTDVAEVEATRMESLDYPQITSYKDSGKQVFATWTKTGPGEKSTVTMDFEHRSLALPAAGAKYEIVFEKQATVQGTYRFEVTAPVGFIFEETSSPVFDYEGSDPPGRLVVQLTLQPVH